MKRTISYDLKAKRIKENRGWLITGWIVVGLAILNPFFIMFLSKTGFSVKEIGDLGALGDFLGGSTVGLLSLASILFVIYTISIQSIELKLQRKELEETRKEFKTGNNTARVQQVDNAFFNMLSLHHELVNNITYRENNSTYKSREALAALCAIIKEDLCRQLNYLEYNKFENTNGWKNTTRIRGNQVNALLSREIALSQEAFDEVYEDFHKNYGNEIGHYMRHNYRIVKFIVNNVASDEKEQYSIKKSMGREPIIGDKKYYFGMLRSQWSNAEFDLIFINSLYKRNYKFKELIVKYDVLDIENRNNADLETFKIKDSVRTFLALKNLIEIKKN